MFSPLLYLLSLLGWLVGLMAWLVGLMIGTAVCGQPANTALSAR